MTAINDDPVLTTADSPESRELRLRTQLSKSLAENARLKAKIEAGLKFCEERAVPAAPYLARKHVDSLMGREFRLQVLPRLRYTS